MSNRMRRTSEAMSLFTKALIDAHKKGEVGSENLDLGLPDGDLNLKVRTAIAELGDDIGPADVQALQQEAFDLGQVTDEEALYLLKLGLDEDRFEGSRDDKGGTKLISEEGRKARFDLLRFAVMHLADIDPKKTATENEASLAANAQVMREYLKGTVRAIRSNGEAKAAYLQAGQRISKNVRAQAALSDLAVDASALDVKDVFLKQTEAINGWSFFKEGGEHNVLVKPGINWGINGYPSVSSWQSVYASALGTLEKGQAAGAHVRVTVADESGIENKAFGRTTMDNMEDTGILGGAILAGIENALVNQGVNKDAAHERALAEIAAVLVDEGQSIPDPLSAEGVAPLIRRHHTSLIALAEQGGVKVIPLDEQETRILKPVAKGPDEPLEVNEVRMTKQQLDALKHFKKGIKVSVALDDVTDIINLPKPPGRHGIMSNCGLTGASKNYIGLMSGVDRSENLHSKWARTPPQREGESAGNYIDRLKEFSSWLGGRGVNREDVNNQQHVGIDDSGLGDWEANEAELIRTAEEWVGNLKHESQRLADEDGEEAEGPGQQFFEKLAELSLFFDDKQRFTFTDMRKTVGSFGPDFGEEVSVGKAIASDKNAVVDALAAAALKEAYERDGHNTFGREREFEELEDAPKGIEGFPARLKAKVRDALSNKYKEAQNEHFMKKKNPFHLKHHAAMMQYPGLAPTDMMNVNMRLLPDSALPNGFLGQRSLRPGKG